ncbi:hypothetical protein HMPREF3227_00408 [Corynebacterium sp. CMW7794]|uniref:Uncharacterized protein n=1 Tax=Corynebacterium phoceense TaxID=1686286 RepID=A0A540R9J8_9CORY|nr:MULTISPECIES: hypothetical protein [Corynebacterium]KXB54697.1 hypothetical protein HMPREF0307_01447 [Corynebacterium sp. DNF00584]KXI19398.1 hypothetical protein HMPREF3227_00408 [Corynebacterium sp. CMW7794]TQE44406.1 hypothetical protein EJK80_02160 [Corynebacterium phoceense]
MHYSSRFVAVATATALALTVPTATADDSSENSSNATGTLGILSAGGTLIGVMLSSVSRQSACMQGNQDACGSSLLELSSAGMPLSSAAIKPAVEGIVAARAQLEKLSSSFPR